MLFSDEDGDGALTLSEGAPFVDRILGASAYGSRLLNRVEPRQGNELLFHDACWLGRGFAMPQTRFPLLNDDRLSLLACRGASAGRDEVACGIAGVRETIVSGASAGWNDGTVSLDLYPDSSWAADTRVTVNGHAFDVPESGAFHFEEPGLGVLRAGVNQLEVRTGGFPAWVGSATGNSPAFVAVARRALERLGAGSK